VGSGWRRGAGDGWCPKGRKALDGPLDAKYQLMETMSASYLQRTEWNVRDSDGTLIFTFAQQLTGGSLRTKEFAEKHIKPCLHVNRTMYQPEAEIPKFIAKHNIKLLNVAGSRESKEPGIYDWVKQILDTALFSSESHQNILEGSGEG
jgi:putative molybdenum carrier protein